MNKPYKVDVYITLSGNILVYYSHNQVALRTFKSIKPMFGYFKRNDLVVDKTHWAVLP